jgi:biopolymer transport protein ExbB
VRAVLLALLWLLPTMAIAAPPRTWEQARADEAEALKAERDALRKSLNTAKSSTAAVKASLRKDIEKLSGELTRLQVANASLERSLPGRERDRSSQAQSVALEELIARLAARGEVALPSDIDARAALLPELITAQLEVLSRDGMLRVESDAEVFDVAGHATKAPVLHIGRVAAMRWDGSGHPLVATPEGFRTVQGEFAGPERFGDAMVATAVLYDDADPPDPGSFVSQGWRAKMDAGGPVMWVLLVIGAIAALIILERTVGLAWAATRWRFEQRRFAAAVREAHTKSLLHVQGWIAKPLVIAAAARCPSCSVTVDVDVEERATQALMVMREQLQRRLSLVNVTAGVAPLLGLLGTVTGMIHTFSVVTDTGTSEPELLAAGISEALLTTQFGLAIAIPAYLAHALLTRGARRILSSAEQAVLAYLHGGDGHGHDHDAGEHHHHHHHHHHEEEHDHG